MKVRRAAVAALGLAVGGSGLALFSQVRRHQEQATLGSNRREVDDLGRAYRPQVRWPAVATSPTQDDLSDRSSGRPHRSPPQDASLEEEEFHKLFPRGLGPRGMEAYQQVLSRMNSARGREIRIAQLSERERRELYAYRAAIAELALRADQAEGIIRIEETFQRYRRAVLAKDVSDGGASFSESRELRPIREEFERELLQLLGREQYRRFHAHVGRAMARMDGEGREPDGGPWNE